MQTLNKNTYILYSKPEIHNSPHIGPGFNILSIYQKKRKKTDGNITHFHRGSHRVISYFFSVDNLQKENLHFKGKKFPL